jgi:hypothetical protein
MDEVAARILRGHPGSVVLFKELPMTNQVGKQVNKTATRNPQPATRNPRVDRFDVSGVASDITELVSTSNTRARPSCWPS